MFDEVPWPVYHSRWNLDQENEVLADHDVALLPPYPGPWGYLKSSNKKLTGWAAGLPVTDAQHWDDLLALFDWRRRRDEARAGYDILTEGYQTQRTAAEWNEVITELMKGADDV